MDNLLSNTLSFIVILLISLIIIRTPYLGVVLTVSSLTVTDLLPSLGIFDTILPIIGGMSLAGFLVHLKKSNMYIKKHLNVIFIFGLLFIVWMVASSPRAALGANSRNWLFTFIQLLVLMVLSSELLDTPQKQHTLMWVFSFLAILSAFYAIQTGNIGESDNLSSGAQGFTDNANAAARLFTVAMVFLTYLRSLDIRPSLKMIASFGIVITYIGVFFTVSRTGMVLLVAAQAMLFLFQSSGKQRTVLILISVLGIFVVWFFASNAFVVAQTILPSVTEGTDTMGMRYSLWEAGWRMFKDRPLTGVGIGNYIGLLHFYGTGLPFLTGKISWAHNTYIQILSETGLIGFLFFMGMYVFTFSNLILSKNKGEKQGLSLRRVWLITLIIMLLGGITKSDHADKLTWMVMGISAFFANQSLLPQEKQFINEADVPKRIRARKISSLRRSSIVK